jgi:hypothetical protein
MWTRGYEEGIGGIEDDLHQSYARGSSSGSQLYSTGEGQGKSTTYLITIYLC